MSRWQSWRLASVALVICFASTLLPGAGRAQTLSETVNDIFAEFTTFELGEVGTHAEHFLPANTAAGAGLITAFESLLTAGVSSIPLSSTISGVTFDFSSGVPVAQTGAQGPIFAERATTLGRGRLNVAATYSYQAFKSFRGIPTTGLVFQFAHSDAPGPNQEMGVLGDNDNEFDILTLDLDMDVKAHVFAFSGTYGITDNFDLGVVLPIAAVSLDAVGVATFDSFTAIVLPEGANHFYGTSDNKLLSSGERSFSNSVTGIGDIALRGKYTLFRGQSNDFGVFVDARLPTGDKENFLGTGEPNISTQALVSSRMGDFNPHLNIGYVFRGAQNDPNRFEIIAGFDQKATERLTVAAEFIGSYVAESRGANIVIPDAVRIRGVGNGGFLNEPLEKSALPANIPNMTDDRAALSVGARWSAGSSTQLFANVLAPMNDGGIRASWVPTIGFQMTF